MDNNDDAPARRNIKRIIIKGSIGFCATLILLAVVLIIILKNGTSFNDLTIGRVIVSRCNVIWNEKIELEIDTITISEESKPRQTTADIRFIKKTINVSQIFARFFSKVNIRKFKIGERILAINLNQENAISYTLDLTTEYTNFHSRLVFESDALVIDIVESANTKYNTRATGLIRLDAKDEKAIGTIFVVINESFPVTIDIVSDSEKFRFEGKEAGKILEIKSLVDLFGLSPNIQRWITEYLSGSRYHLKSFEGEFPWDTPGVMLDTLEAEVRVDDTEYTFASGLEPVNGEYTDVFFAKGVLAIKPHNATFYGQDCGASTVEIDFNDPSNIILTVDLKTDAVANTNILRLLDHYHIGLPFKQVGGTTGTDLRLTINLNKRQVGAEGTFTISEGLISYGSTVFEVRDARILLVNSDVTLDQLTVDFKDLITAHVTGTIQAKEGIGDLDILLEQINIDVKGSILNLDDSVAGPRAKYHFDDNGHVLEAGPSSWQLDSKKIDIGSFRAPVSLDDFSMELPPVRVDIPPGIQTELSGFFSLRNKKANISCDILKYHVSDLLLLSPNISVDFDYDQELVFRTEETAYLSLSNIPVTLYPSEFRLDDEFFKISKSGISYGSFFDSRLAGQFNHRLAEGTFYLKKIDVTNENLENNLDIGDETLVEVRTEDEKFVVNCPEFDLRISSDKDKNWSASFGNLSSIYSRSRLLQKYKIKTGSLTISSENGKRPYNFSADILSPYLLFIDGDGPVEELNITGKLSDLGVTASINKDLHIEYADKQLGIASSNLAFNVPAVISLIKERPKSTGDSASKDSGIIFSLNAENSHLYLSPNSKILADLIEFEYLNGIIKMRLLHGPGRIVMKVEDEHFLADGSNLNDVFMGALIQGSSFQGGLMSIAAMGAFDEFSVLFEIKDTVLNNLKTLNNVMALINTVPALITFSWPDYNLTGLPLDSAVVGMKFKNKLATFESMEFVSPSLQAAGIGWIDFSERLMDLDVNLTTQRKENIRKIPIVGYILHGKKGEASMTIKIKGGVDDPEVTHSLFREIISKPFKILFRTLGLPIHALQELSRESENQQQNDQTLN